MGQLKKISNGFYKWVLDEDEVQQEPPELVEYSLRPNFENGTTECWLDKKWVTLILENTVDK